MIKSNIFIVAAKRTPFGAYGGSLKNKTCTDLGEIAAKAAIESIHLDPKLIDSVTFGNVIQSNSDTGYLSRHVGLRCGVKHSTPSLTLNRLCGSGFQSLVTGAYEIELGHCDICLVGGSENMSESPFVVRNVRFGTKLGIDYKFEDVLWSALFDKYINIPMGITAENLAEKYGITRQECDEYALLSQKRWKQANDNGIFNAEMAPVQLKNGKKGGSGEVIKKDEHPRENASIESLAKLPAVFKKQGTVTAGNASGVCDGAGSLIIASESAMKQHNITKPLARIVGYAVVGCDPSIMGIGPVPAIQKLLAATNIPLDKIDLIEVNEAFAAQYLAVEKELNLNRQLTNTNGGAIALGHPVGASGSRILAHLAHELNRTNGRYGLGSACIGGGQGIAVLLERQQ